MPYPDSMKERSKNKFYNKRHHAHAPDSKKKAKEEDEEYVL